MASLPKITDNEKEMDESSGDEIQWGLNDSLLSHLMDEDIEMDLDEVELGCKICDLKATTRKPK